MWARIKGTTTASLEGVKLTDAQLNECRARLIAAEKNMPFIYRHCQGDASETGLVQFAEPIYSLEETRNKFPTHAYKQGEKPIECLIPFSSDIKFNLFIRDMAKDNRNPSSAEENLCVYMKGAPERILSRCSKIFIDGQEVPFTEERRKEVQAANSQFGKMGERVLAFARLRLSPEKYKKDSYEFDVSTWKQWGYDVNQTKEDYSEVDGSFPMHDLCLVGVVSLNDPPRQRVDLSVRRCRDAGIKVIMVTGDQPPTAAAIANKVCILQNPEKEYNYMKDVLGMPAHQAWNESTGVVVHGDELAKKHLEEDLLDDMDPEKGRYLQDWISKDEVVFARTTPSQKLLIVDACQKAGHVVAVTGDGVNDSPAIKKADIGIAMGSGSDVAKNAADMLLLDDNFSSIVNGVEEGRLIFDNLKKSIAYTLESNIPEILPFIFFIIFQVPLPLSTVLILCIDLGCDMVPAISFAYENPELDIMERVPRNSKRDHLVNSKLISYSYLQKGMIQGAAGMFTYFAVLNDYGIRPSTLWGLTGLQAPLPGPKDIWDPTKLGNGNSRMDVTDESELVTLGWDFTRNAKIDIRLFYSYNDYRTEEAWTKCRFPTADDEWPKFYRYSSYSEYPICYSTDALKYAQSAFLASIVTVQAAGLITAKSRNLSLYQQGMINGMGNFGLFFEFVLLAFLLYLKPLNPALGTRQVAFPHFAAPSMSFYIVIFFIDELRKIYVRKGMVKEDGITKYKGWIVQNTYY